MPWLVKNCIICSRWIQRNRRYRNCLCKGCMDKVNRQFKERIRKHGPIVSKGTIDGD